MFCATFRSWGRTLTATAPLTTLGRRSPNTSIGKTGGLAVGVEKAPYNQFAGSGARADVKVANPALYWTLILSASEPPLSLNVHAWPAPTELTWPKPDNVIVADEV